MLSDRVPPRVLVAVALAAGLTFQLLLGTSYVAAFLDPVPESTGVPVAVVNEDAGPRGAEMIERLRSAATPVAWMDAGSREDAMAGLAGKRYYGALLLPANFSEAIASFASTDPRPALVETISNPGSSATGSLVAERVMQVALERLRAGIRDAALDSVEPDVAPGLGAVTLAQARYIADPVHASTTVANPVNPDGVNGLAPMALAMAAWIGGYFGAVALERFRDRTRLTAGRRALVVAGGALAQAAIATAIVVAVGLRVPDAVALAGVIALGTWLAYALVGLLLDLVGLAGVVPAFAIMALGLPSSGGVYPAEMLPPFFRALHDLSPFTWMVEASRTTLYAAGASDLPSHALRLAVVALVATALSLAWARVQASRSTPSRVAGA